MSKFDAKQVGRVSPTGVTRHIRTSGYATLR